MHNNFKAFILTIIFWLLILSSPLESLGIDIGYLDELMVIAFIPLSFSHSKKSVNINKIFIYLIIFIVISLTAFIYSEYYRGLALSILDIFLFLKPIIFIICFANLPYNARSKFLIYVSRSSLLYIYSAFAFYFINIYYNIFDYYDNRFGFKSYAFIAANPGEFLNNLVLVGLAIYKNPNLFLRKTTLFIVGFLLITTLRFKAFVLFVGATLLFTIFKKYNKKIFNNYNLRKANINVFFQKYKIQVYLILLIALIPGWTQFKNYFLTEPTPRLLLLQTSLELGEKYFPFGIGPGTFGSAVAQLRYSPVYIDQGFTEVYGLSGEGEVSFLNDNFWPMVFAQYGLVGLILIVLIYIKLARWIFINLSIEKYNYEIFIVLILSLVISTFGSAILIGPLGILYMMILGAIIKDKNSRVCIY